jgi:hypothetical protein
MSHKFRCSGIILDLCMKDKHTEMNNSNMEIDNSSTLLETIYHRIHHCTGTRMLSSLIVELEKY